jgi:acyl carrier protein
MRPKGRVMQPERKQLVQELKSLIFESVNLKHRNPNEVNESTSLMGHGLELDSIDILEIVVAVENRYHITIKEGEQGKLAFRTVGSIADFVESQRK